MDALVGPFEICLSSNWKDPKSFVPVGQRSSSGMSDLCHILDLRDSLGKAARIHQYRDSRGISSHRLTGEMNREQSPGSGCQKHALDSKDESTEESD